MGERNWTRFLRRAPVSHRAKRHRHGNGLAPANLVGVVYRHWGAHPTEAGKDICQFLREHSHITDADEMMRAYLERMAAYGRMYHIEPDISEETRRAAWHSDSIFIEWMYDIEVGEGEEPTVTVYPGPGLIQLPNPIMGTADEIEKWIDSEESEDRLCSDAVEKQIKDHAKSLGIQVVEDKPDFDQCRTM